MIQKYNDILEKYKKLLVNIDKKYSYDFMNDGSFISPSLRRAYASILPSGQFSKEHNPFDISGSIGLFAKKNFLLSKKSTRYAPLGIENVDNNKLKFYLVNKLFRILLYIIGPNQFANISRLLVFLSSYRLNRKLWKI